MRNDAQPGGCAAEGDQSPAEGDRANGLEQGDPILPNPQSAHAFFKTYPSDWPGVAAAIRSSDMYCFDECYVWVSTTSPV